MWYSNNYRADLKFRIRQLFDKIIILNHLFSKSGKVEYQEQRADVEIACADGSIFVSL